MCGALDGRRFMLLTCHELSSAGSRRSHEMAVPPGGGAFGRPLGHAARAGARPGSV